MSENSGLPEWTAQALVALGAVFLLISAYVMGVMVPNGLLAPNDFDADFYFEGDIETFDLDADNRTGAFFDIVGSGSYEPTAAKVDGGATLNVVGKPDGDDYTILTQNFSLTENGIDGEGEWLGTISDTTDDPSMLDRKSYEVDGKQGTWTPTNVPESGKTYEFPNPVNSDYTDNFTCSDKRMLDGLEVMTCVAQSGEDEKMTFVPGEGSDLETLQETFESYNDLGSPGVAPMWFDYRAEYIVGTEIGGVVDRVYNVTVYMEVPQLVYLDNKFNFTREYEGVVGGVNTATFINRYYDATGFRSGCVMKDSSTDEYINIMGYLRIFETFYDENGTAITPDVIGQGGVPDGFRDSYGVQSSEGCWASPTNQFGASDGTWEELVNVTYNVSRTTTQFEDGHYDPDGDGWGYDFFAPMCSTISATDRTCWVPAEDGAWPNAMHNPHIQDYTFVGEVEWNGTYAGVAYHFRANETGIQGNTGSLYQETLQTGLEMDFFEDVWVDPVTGTVLDQKYDIQIKVPNKDECSDVNFTTKETCEAGADGIAGDDDTTADIDESSDDGTWIPYAYSKLMLRDIVANYTEEAKEGAADSADIQALAQYYQGSEVVVLTLNGAYTDKTVDDQIESQKESVAALKLGSQTLPSILIGGALVSLLAGFYVYYQTGGLVNATDVSEPVADEGPAESVPDEEVSEDEDKQEMAIPQETESSDEESSDEESSDKESSDEESPDEE